MPEDTGYAITDAIGTSGLKHTGGMIYEEFLPRLQGIRGIKVFREMVDNSAEIGAMRFLIKLLVRQVEWRLEPADDSDAAKEVAEFVEGALYDMQHTFESMIEEALTALDYGWAYMDTTFKLRKGRTDDKTTRSKHDDGGWGWRQIALRAQDTLFRWEIADDGEILGMHQMDTFVGTQAFLPMERSLLFRTETVKNNPEGRSLFRNAAVSWHNLKRVCQIELVGIERDMTGLLTMEVPLELLQNSAGPSEVALRNELRKMLSELKRDEREFAMVPPEMDRNNMPTGYKLKLLATGGRRQIDTDASKKYYKIGILQTVLAQFIELGMGLTGSHSLVSSSTNTFSMAMNAIMDGVIAAPFNRTAIPRLCELNEFDPDLTPELVHGDIETPPLKEVGEYVSALAGAGFDLSDDGLHRKLREIGNLPPPPEDQVLPGEIEEEPEVEEPEIEEPEVLEIDEPLDDDDEEGDEQ